MSPRSPPLVYAVMANPDILKHVGRKCTDAEVKFNYGDLKWIKQIFGSVCGPSGYTIGSI